MSFVRLLALVSGCLLAVAVAAGTPDYPNKPVQLIVPYGAGGAVDVISRVIADRMSQSLGQPVVVLNRPGANANIGPSVVAQAAPDGYTLLASSAATVVNPLLEHNLAWHMKDFVAVARLAQAPNVVVVPASLQLSTLAAFVAHAKENPGSTTSMAGPGTPQTMATEYFAQAAGIDLLEIAYKGGVSYVPDLISGTLAMSIAPMNVVFQLVKNGKLVALANTSDRRSPLLPQVPTMAESGYPEATGVSWYGIHAPAGTPEPIVVELARAVQAATADEKVKERIAAVGAEVAYLDTPAFESFLATEVARARNYMELIRARKNKEQEGNR